MAEPKDPIGAGTRTVPVISGRGMGKTFGGGAVIALEGATFDVKSGSFVSLVGPSGCGKSTLLRLIRRADRPDLRPSHSAWQGHQGPPH